MAYIVGIQVRVSDIKPLILKLEVNAELLKSPEADLWLLLPSLGFPVGSHRSLLLLGLLGAHSVRGCNQGHGAREVAVLLKARSPLARRRTRNLKDTAGRGPDGSGPGTS